MRAGILRFIFSVSVLYFTFAFAVHAENLPDPIQERVGHFFERLQKAEVQPAIEDIIQGGMISQNSEQVQNLINQINNAINIYGSIRASDYVSSKTLGDSLCKAVYLSKHVNYPLRWTFIFYKNEKDWVLVNIEFDDNVEALF
jgi:hypothetical protein